MVMDQLKLTEACFQEFVSWLQIPNQDVFGVCLTVYL